MTTTKVTVLGLGAMGAALAATLVRAGHATTVWNRSPGKAEALVDLGATAADTVHDAVTAADVVIACLFDADSVHEVLDPVADLLTGRTLVNVTTTTPDQSREIAGWAAAHGVTYLDGGIMAVPHMIGQPGSSILYSGSAAAFEQHRLLLDLWGESAYFGEDAGLASLYDLALLAGMYVMFAGFLHGAAMLAAEGVPAAEFAARQAPFLAAMTGSLAHQAATVDAKDYAGAGQSLRFTETALAALIRAGTEQGVGAEVLQPVHAMVRRQIEAGFGEQDTARIFEELRSTR